MEEDCNFVDSFLDSLDDVQILYFAVPMFKVSKHFNEVSGRLHEVQRSDNFEDGVVALVDLPLSELLNFFKIIDIL